MGKVALFAVILLIATTSYVYADVVWGNDFFNENRDKTQGLNRQVFCANGSEGFVTKRIEPNHEADVLNEYKNGAIILLDRVYIHEGGIGASRAPIIV